MKKTDQKNNSAQTVAISEAFGDRDSYNEYYHHISVLFRIVSFILFITFLFVIIVSAFANESKFSYENLQYIIRNFALELDENQNDSKYSIRYNPDASRSFALFGNGLAVCGATELLIFSATGRLTCKDSVSFKSPIMSASDKYVLVYDDCGTSYSVYNSFTQVHSDTLDMPIRGAAVSDSGAYALITGSDDYNSVIKVYNSDFQLINSVNRIDYITSLDISDSSVLYTSININSDNKYTTTAGIFAFGKEEHTMQTTIENNFAVSTRFTDNGFIVIGAEASYFYDQNGHFYGEYRYDTNTLSDFAYSGSSILLLFKTPGLEKEYHVSVLDSTGQITYEHSFRETVYDVVLELDTAYILTERALHSVNASYAIVKDINNADHSSVLLACGNRSVYVCSQTSAPLISFTE